MMSISIVFFVEAHITVVVLDLCEMRLKDFRQDIILMDDGLYQRCLEEDIVSCDVSTDRLTYLTHSCLLIWLWTQYRGIETD